MKKSLTLVLAIAMVFTMFASVAFAADATTTASTDTQTKFDALKAAGVMTGTVVDGQVVAGLDLNMDRASFAEVLVNLYNLPKVATTSSFSDVPADHWALQQIEAAKTAGYMLGNGDGTFNPDGKITLQELASALCEANGLTPVANAEVAGADAWAAGYVAAAVNAKLLASVSDYTAAATRADLVVGTYQTYENVQAAQAPSATFSATGAKEITVTFNHAVDGSKAAITVNKGTIPVNVSATTWSADKTSAKIALVAVMTAGDYTVTVKGVSTDDLTGKVTVEDQKVAKINFSSDKAAYARDAGTGNPDTTKVTTSLKVLNQYGEDVTSTYASQVKVNSGIGTASAPDSNGAITIDNNSNNILLGQQFPVTAVYAYNSVFATTSATLTVSSMAQAATVTIAKVYNADDKTLKADTVLTTDEFDILFNAKDQYGNDIAVNNTNATLIQNDLLVTGSNNAVVSYNYASNKPVFGTVTVDDTDYFKLQLKEPAGGLTAGTNTVYLMSNTTGNKASIDVAVKDTVKVDTLTLSAPTIAVDDEKTTIPFTAVDQFGQAITDATDITNGLNGTLTVSGVTGLDATFSQDYVKDQPVLTLNAKQSDNAHTAITDPTTIYISGVTKTYKIVQLTLTLQPAKKPVVISGITTDTKKAIAEGAVTSLENDHINILDQYGRSNTLDDFTGYYVSVESSDTNKVTASGAQVNNAGNTSVDLNGVASGSSTITLTIKKTSDNSEVANSAYNFNERVVKQADIASYKVDDVAKVFTGTVDGSTVTISAFDDYAQDVTVVGLLSDGTTEVAVPTGDSRYYTVNVNAAVTYNSVTGSVYGTNAAALAADTDADKTYTLVVVGNTSTGVQTIAKDVTVSTVAPKVTTLALDDGDFTTAESDGVVSVSKAYLVANATTKEQIAEDAVSVQDQYGKDVADADKFTSVIASNFSESTRNSVGTVHAGDTFTITAIDSVSGSVISFKVVVND